MMVQLRVWPRRPVIDLSEAWNLCMLISSCHRVELEREGGEIRDLRRLTELFQQQVIVGPVAVLHPAEIINRQTGVELPHP